jgi:hypothetical protein
MIPESGEGQCARSARSEISEDDGSYSQYDERLAIVVASAATLSSVRTRSVLDRVAKDGRSVVLGSLRPPFTDFGAAFHGAEHQECCGIGAIIPPTLPPWIGEFVREIQCALQTLLTRYTTVPELPDYEGIDVRDLFWID